MKKLLFVLLLFSQINLEGQLDAHYWTHQYGAKGLLLNGAVIATAEDETNIFYNPGALGMDDNIGFAFSFLTPTYMSLLSKNFLADNQQATDEGVDFSPGFLAVRFQPFKDKRITFGIASFERFKSDINLKDRFVDFINSQEAFLLQADLNFRRKVSEDWFALSASFNISDNLGIGISQFSAWHSESLELGLKKEIVSAQNPQEIVASWRTEFDYDFSIYNGFITKLGMTLQYDDFKAGLTYTSPMYHITSSSASYSLDDQRLVLLNNTSPINSVVSNRDGTELEKYKTPYSVGLGFEFVNGRRFYSISAEYFSSVDRYTVFQDAKNAFDIINVESEPVLVEVEQGNESVLNLAIGYQFMKNDKVTWIAGFRTDFNENNSLLLNQSAEYLSTSPDIYHISGGGMFHFGKNVFSIGLDLGYGQSKKGIQLADVSDVNIENLFSFSGQENVTNRFFSAMLFLTYDFIFNTISEP